MHVTTVLAVFASTALAGKTFVPIVIPNGFTNFIPGPKLAGNIIPGPDQKQGDGPYKFDYNAKLPKELDDFIEDKCNAVPECSSTGRWARIHNPGHEDSDYTWELTLYKGGPTTVGDYVQDTTNYIYQAQYNTVQGSKKKKAHRAH